MAFITTLHFSKFALLGSPEVQAPAAGRPLDVGGKRGCTTTMAIEPLANAQPAAPSERLPQAVSAVTETLFPAAKLRTLAGLTGILGALMRRFSRLLQLSARPWSI